MLRDRFGIARAFGRGSLLCMALLLASCSKEGRVQLEVRNLADTSAAPLTDMGLTVDADKYHWPSLGGGEVRRVNLWPGPDGAREVVLYYTQAGNPKSWVGPRLGVSQQGYLVRLDIDADGSVSSRHCAQPCSLDK